MVLPVPEEAAHRLVFSTLGVMQLGKLSRFDTALRPGRVARSVAWDLLVAWGVSQHALESRKVAARTLSEEILS